MKNIKHSSTTDLNQKPSPTAHVWTAKSLATIRTTARDFANPVDYQHPYPSMAQFANHLALSYDANRTRHSYYRQVRLIHEHLGCDPATITESQLRDYFLFVKLQKHWKPKSIRQALAAASMFFVKLLRHEDWTLFSQIRTKDDTLPAVLTRQQVHDLLAHIRLRRYRTPLKLIYCCGLRLFFALARGSGHQAESQPAGDKSGKSFHRTNQQVIKQIWISTQIGVLSGYPCAADTPFPFIRPVVLPPHSAVKQRHQAAHAAAADSTPRTLPPAAASNPGPVGAFAGD